MMECTAFKELSVEKKHTLHVQSHSYWAPANIGPYSQACRVNDLIYMAGMIGFDPSSMELKHGDNALETFRLQALQCVQNCSEIAICMQTELRKDALMCICYVIESYQLNQARKLLKELFPKIICVVVQVPRLPRDAMVEFHFVLGDSKTSRHPFNLVQSHQYHPNNTLEVVEYGSTRFQYLSLQEFLKPEEVGLQIYSSIMEIQKGSKILLVRVFAPCEYSTEELYSYLSQNLSCAISIIPVRNRQDIQVLTFLRPN
jgi:enamine deaminase RidA (YjgF/YER057c/UK114 family)